MAIPAAIGYPQYSGTLIENRLSTKILENLYCSSVLADIAMIDYEQDEFKHTDSLTFLRAPRIAINDLAKDGRIIHSTIDTCAVTMTIDYLKHFSVKIDEEDRKKIKNWAQWEKLILDGAKKSMAQTIDSQLLAYMPIEASGCNKGINAGIQSGRYNLGTVGAAISINSLNIWSYLTYMQAVLDEQCVPEGDRFIVLPKPFKPILQSAPTVLANPGLSGACCDIAKDIITNGRLPMQMAGFDVYFSQSVATAFDPAANGDAYSIVAGSRDATAFAATTEEMRMMFGKDVNSYADYIQGRMAYGYKTIEPNRIAVLYARAN